ncbi:MAG: 16S rRNA (cytosine(1402)-N(4))-methyltransferase RsmH [Nitrospirae bacterium]|nr:16S rRNA (cytosine(1402)-N(4))-methyltransferase RsmH [Nitrospirota bacterium]
MGQPVRSFKDRQKEHRRKTCSVRSLNTVDGRFTIEISHLPVLQKEVSEMLRPGQNGIYVDATVGIGGHAENILRLIGPRGKLIGIDRDEDALKIAYRRLSNERVVLKKGNFSDMEVMLFTEGIREADGILFDLGISMLQLKEPGRGFSFISDERLDMRMDKTQSLSAWDVVNKYPERELERIIREFGEDRLSRKIAVSIVRQRSGKIIDTCSELSKLVERVYGKRGRIRPATKTFQALRIEVNKELDQLKAGLDASVRLLKRGGRLCVISYHSLEDRIVKNFISNNSKKGLLKVITKKPVTPGHEEIKMNPSSRSAKLRAAEKI